MLGDNPFRQKLCTEAAGFDLGELDAQRSQFGAHRLCGAPESLLNGGQHACPGERHFTEDGRHLKHMAGTLAPQDRQRGTQHVHGAEEARVEKVPRLFVAGAFNRAHQREASIVEDHIDTTELPDRPADGYSGGLFIAYVRREGECPARKIGHQFFDRAGVSRGCRHKVPVLQSCFRGRKTHP